MDKVLRWFVKGVHSLTQVGRAADDEAYTSFERVNCATLGVGGFRASASMHLDEAPIIDFAETMPAYVHSASARRPAAHLLGRRAA